MGPGLASFPLLGFQKNSPSVQHIPLLRSANLHNILFLITKTLC